jgi:hypothetical protein
MLPPSRGIDIDNPEVLPSQSLFRGGKKMPSTGDQAHVLLVLRRDMLGEGPLCASPGRYRPPGIRPSAVFPSLLPLSAAVSGGTSEGSSCRQGTKAPSMHPIQDHRDERSR